MRAFPVVFVVFALGCGSRTLSAFSVEEGDGGATVSDTGATGTTDGGTTTDDGGVVIEDGSVPGEDAVVVDGGTKPPADTGTTGGGSISCGAMVCDATKQECCVTGGGGGGFSTECVAKGACMGDVSLACTDSKPCASGQVCCLTLSAGEAKCAKTCTSGGGGPGGGSYILCSTDSECPKGQSCRNSMVPGIKVCQGAGGPGGGGGGGTPGG